MRSIASEADASGPNDEVERRGDARAQNEDALSQSSTSSLAYRRRDPRSLEPIVRSRRAYAQEFQPPPEMASHPAKTGDALDPSNHVRNCRA